jgi:hypothetical protein
MGARLRLPLTVLGTAWLVVACQSSAPPAVEPRAETVATRPLAMGDRAPDFSLPGTDGKQHQLSDYRGRQAVVLAWFSKAFTEG